MQDLLSRLGTLDAKIAFLPLDKIARETGFFRRAPRKTDAALWLRAVCLLSSLPARSYRTLAWMVGLIDGSTHSKQSASKRVNAEFERYLKEVLGRVCADMAGPGCRADPVLAAFKRVVVQDSTVVPLSARLADRFPGAANQTGKASAGVRVQAFFDLLSESCLAFSVSAFTRNDQKASADILELARRGDLVVRDLGYSSIAVFKRLKDVGADLLNRLRCDTNVYDADGGRIDLLEQLERHGTIDRTVLIGEAKLPLRLIAIPLPEAVAAERRRKAKANRDRRLKHSKKRMRLLGWQILITTVPTERLGAEDAAKIYGLRWRIETLFKAWKSHFDFGSVPARASSDFVAVLVLASLLYIALFQCVFQRLRQENPGAGPPVSHLKLASLMQNLLALELRMVLGQLSETELLHHTLYHCRYDKRKRPNHFQIMGDLSGLSLG